MRRYKKGLDNYGNNENYTLYIINFDEQMFGKYDKFYTSVIIIL